MGWLIVIFDQKTCISYSFCERLFVYLFIYLFMCYQKLILTKNHLASKLEDEGEKKMENLNCVWFNFFLDILNRIEYCIIE